MLVSGRGSNLQALIDAIEHGDLPARISVVVSNRPAALALERCRQHGIASRVVELKSHGSRAAQHSVIGDFLEEHGVELVVLAGFDRILDPGLVRRFVGRILNIHPSLLPAFGKSLQSQREALEYGVKITGCTVHFVTEDVDGGPIVVQRPVPVREDDDEPSLSARILAEEHRALPEAVRLFAEGRLRIEGRRVQILDAVLR